MTRKKINLGKPKKIISTKPLPKKLEEEINAIKTQLVQSGQLKPHMDLLTPEIPELAQHIAPIFERNNKVKQQIDSLPDFTYLIADTISEKEQQAEVAFYIRQQVIMHIQITAGETPPVDKRKEIRDAQKTCDQLREFDILLRGLFNNYPLVQREFWDSAAKDRDINLVDLSSQIHMNLYQLRALASDVVNLLEKHPR